MNKRVFNDSFNYGLDDSLVEIVDNPDVLNKKVASAVRSSWGEVKPEKGRQLVHVIALGTFEKVGKNSNADAFEEAVCRKSHGDFVKRARLYRNHKKTAEEKKDGDVIKSALNEKMGRVELLISAIEDKCADWLGDLDKGGQVKFSMGWHCTDGDICSICNHRAHRRDQYCEHVNKTASAPYGLGKILPDGRACFVYNRDGYWNDISKVDVGADMTAMDLCKVASENGVTIGGAELDEIYSQLSETLDAKKVAAERIYSLFSKTALATTLVPLMIKNASTHNEEGSAREQFKALHKSGSVAGFDQFVQIMSTSFGHDMDEHFKSAMDNFGELMSEILSSQDKMHALTKVAVFDKLPSSVNLFPVEQSNDEFLDCFMKAERPTIKTAKTKVAKAIVEHYVAYKLACVKNAELNDSQLFDFFLVN